MDKTAGKTTGTHLIRTQSQNRRLHYWLGVLKVSAENKAEMVYAHTNGRENRSCALRPEECEEMIKSLKRMANGLAAGSYKGKHQEGTSTPPFVPKDGEKDDRANKMRRKVISIGHELGWKKENGKIDMVRVNEFCVKRGHGHKSLNEYNVKELPKLITQFEQLIKSQYAKG